MPVINIRNCSSGKANELKFDGDDEKITLVNDKFRDYDDNCIICCRQTVVVEARNFGVIYYDPAKATIVNKDGRNIPLVHPDGWSFIAFTSRVGDLARFFFLRRPIVKKDNNPRNYSRSSSTTRASNA